MEAKKTKIGLLVGGFVLALAGLALSMFFEQIIFYQFEQELPLKPGSQSFKKWRLTPVPITMSVYFWNWTNPHEMSQADYKPSFVEMGPYVFREIHEKVNLSWNPNGTVTFRTIKRWYFVEEKTNGSLDDNVTSLNAVAASVAYIVRGWNRFFLYPVSIALVTSGQELTWTKTVRELLFDGFDNTLQNIGSYAPGLPALDKFGWFYKRNGTVSADTYTIGTGENGLNEIGELKLWNYRKLSDMYPECSNTGGYSGEFWPPKRKKEDVLKMFTTELCREVLYYYEEESTYRGLKTYIYAGTNLTMDNGTKVLENKCHCDHDFCPPSGVFDVSKCQFGAPVFMSYPHFYSADPYYRNSMRGMHPDKNKHRFYIALEPRTGLQVDIRARMQVNLYLKKNSALSMYSQVKEGFIPVLWMENSVSLSEEYTQGIKIMLKIVEFGPFIYYGMIGLGCLIILGVIFLHFFAPPITEDHKRNGKIQSGSEKVIFNKGEEIQLTGHDENEINDIEYKFSEVKL
ncbi:hypothetical protein RUM44_001027 [Polyplax serrata]|uniref:Uncharacterized protein n=1 Tax=Polyplax serrata TaxID=468196 RepID=A0ABR1B9C4_POLSC